MKIRKAFVSNSSSSSFIIYQKYDRAIINSDESSGGEAPKNNDGLDNCYKCGRPNKKIPGAFGTYFYCTCQNPNCSWFGN